MILFHLVILFFHSHGVCSLVFNFPLLFWPLCPFDFDFTKCQFSFFERKMKREREREEKKKEGLTQATRFCSPAGRVLSIALRPVINSRKTTPKLYTSDLTVSCPVMAYSGAQYPYVPITRVDTCVLSPTGPSLASPKSDNFGWKPSPKRMLEDLKSR